MKFVVFLIVAFVAVACHSAKLKCVKRDCFKWAGCVASYNTTSCRCESLCEKSEPECPKLPCLQNGFCYGIRKKSNKCNCVNVCRDPPFCPWGYKKCLNHLNCACKDKPESVELVSSSSSEELTAGPSIVMPSIGLVRPTTPKSKKPKTGPKKPKTGPKKPKTGPKKHKTKKTTPETTPPSGPIDAANFDYVD